ncbi:Probable cyclin-dependent kinase 9 (Cell division protein kinase 9) [Durusdinium trenchii]|uniref:Probable cyclin-dependent kinase 9 (Cell division protein kinase 9) n=1 Tax=Durusdinium trenchii TaxID=1381693 RepID=A0ABP0LHK0_9DINO
MPSAWAGVEADPESAHGLQPGAGVGTSLPTPRAVRDVLIGKDLASGERLPWTLQQLWTHSQVDVMSIIQSNSQLNTFEDSAVENQQFHAIPKDQWPESLKKLHAWEKFWGQISRQGAGHDNRDLFVDARTKHGKEAADLLKASLHLDPGQRLDSEQMKRHDFWSTDPAPCDPIDLKMPGDNRDLKELDVKKRREKEHRDHREHREEERESQRQAERDATTGQKRPADAGGRRPNVQPDENAKRQRREVNVQYGTVVDAHREHEHEGIQQNVPRSRTGWAEGAQLTGTGT